jgi:hypothetical protein
MRHYRPVLGVLATGVLACMSIQWASAGQAPGGATVAHDAHANAFYRLADENSAPKYHTCYAKGALGFPCFEDVTCQLSEAAAKGQPCRCNNDQCIREGTVGPP